MSDAEATAFIYSAHRRPLAPSHPIFEAGNLDRELLARARAPELSQQDERRLMQELAADAEQFTAWGERSAKQQCSQCRCVLPTPYLLSVHISEQHDSFFASQAALRMPVFQCLIEGCSTTFTSVGQRHQHLVDLHQIAPDFGFDRIHLTVHQAQLRPDSIHQNAAPKLPGSRAPVGKQKGTSTPLQCSPAHEDNLEALQSAASRNAQVSMPGAAMEGVAQLQQTMPSPQGPEAAHISSNAGDSSSQSVSDSEISMGVVQMPVVQSARPRGRPVGAGRSVRGRGRHRVTLS